MLFRHVICTHDRTRSTNKRVLNFLFFSLLCPCGTTRRSSNTQNGLHNMPEKIPSRAIRMNLLVAHSFLFGGGKICVRAGREGEEFFCRMISLTVFTRRNVLYIWEIGSTQWGACTLYICVYKNISHRNMLYSRVVFFALRGRNK